MSLNKILTEFENAKEPMLDKMVEYYENNTDCVTITSLQRHFKIGYRRANRAKKQLLQIGIE